MAETDPSSQLQAATPTPVAKLSPDLQDPATRVVRGVVTIVWPYSAFKGTTAFILAEADFRLRRDQGQVRVELSGPSAKAFSEATIAGGDEVALSLDGVTWADKDTKTPIAGSPLPWQLRFKQRLLLQATAGDNTRTIDVNESATEPEAESILPVTESLLEPIDNATPPRAATPELRLPSKRRAEDGPDASEFASPAFIKRARVSYGSLFEGGLDIFDDEALNGGPKKRAKSGRFSSVWRYASRSPTPEPAEPEPEPEQPVRPAEVQPAEKPAVEATPLKAIQMVDGGCQTDPQELSPPREVDAIGEPRLGAFTMDETPSKPPAIFSGIHLPDQSNHYGLGAPHESAPYLSPSGTYPMESSYPEGPLGQPDMGAAQHPQHLAQPSFAVHAMHQNSYHTTPESYHSPILNPDPLQNDYYPAPDEHIKRAEPSLEGQPDHRSPYHLNAAPADDHPQGAHHTVFLDRIAEPPVSNPWGFVTTTPAAPASHSGHDQKHPVELASSSSSSSDGSDAGDANADEDAEQSAFRQSVPWASSARHRTELETAEEEPDLEGDETGMLEVPFDAEDRLAATATSRSAIDTPLDTASFAENDTDASGEDEVRDAGGDYDISQYPNLSHMQDDDNASRVESEYSSQDENHIFAASNQDNEDDEIDEDVESFNEGYDEEEMGNTEYPEDEDQEGYSDEDEEEDEDVSDDSEDYIQDDMPPRPPPQSQGPPQVISLLSDSEDDDDAAPASQSGRSVPSAPASHRLIPQLDGTDDSDGDKLGPTEDASSSVSSSAPASEASESEEEEEEEEEEAEDIQTEGHVKITGHAVEASARVTDREDSPDAAAAEAVRKTSEARGSSENKSIEAVSKHSTEKPGKKEVEEPTVETAQVPEPAAKEVEKQPAQEPEQQPAQEPEQQAAQQPEKEPTQEPEQQSVQPPTDAPKPTQAIEEKAQSPAPAPAVAEGAVDKDFDTFVAVEETIVTQATITETEVVRDEAEVFSEKPIDIEMADAETVRPTTPTPGKEKPTATTSDGDLEMRSDSDADKVEVIDFASQSAVVQTDHIEEASAVADTEMTDAPEVEQPEAEKPTAKAPSPVPVQKDSSPPLRDQDNASQPKMPSEPKAAISSESEAPTDTIEKPASPPATQDTTSKASPRHETVVHLGEGEDTEAAEDVVEAPAEEKEKEVTEDVEDKSQDESTPTPESGLPTPDDTQLHDEYSQGEIDLQLQLTQEEYKPTPASPKATSSERPVTRSMNAEAALSSEPAKSRKTIEKDTAPSTPRTKSAPRSLDSRQTSEAASSEVDGSGPTKSRRSRPGRSRGKERSEEADADPSVRLARASIASRRSTRLSDQQKTPPENVRVTRAVSHNMMRSVSPDDAERDDSVRLAKAALQSPSRQLRAGSTPVLPTHRLLGLTMKESVPDCVALKMLRHHPKQTVDVMAIVTTEPPEPKRAKSGPRGVLLSFNVTDHSIAPSQVVLVNVFRPNESALPAVVPGDVILLRQFTVTAMMGRGFGLRANDGSSWAVFDGQDEDEAPQIRGPPVELTPGDKIFAGLLKKYYGEMDAAAMAHLRRTNEKAMAAAERVKG